MIKPWLLTPLTFGRILQILVAIYISFGHGKLASCGHMSVYGHGYNSYNIKPWHLEEPWLYVSLWPHFLVVTCHVKNNCGRKEPFSHSFI